MRVLVVEDEEPIRDLLARGLGENGYAVDQAAAGGDATSGGARLLSTIVGLVAAQVLVGVPLSPWWRRTGNLLVTDTAHGLLEAARTVVGVG